MILGDFLRNVALVKRVARGFQSRCATLAFVRGFFVSHVLQRGRQLGLHKAFADGGRASVGQKHSRARRPTAVAGLMIGDVFLHKAVHGKALTRQPRGLARDFAEAHGAITRQRHDPRGGCGGHHRAQNAGRHFAAVMIVNILHVRRLGPGAQTVDIDDFARVGKIHHDGCHAREVDAIGLQNAQCHTRRDTSVDRITARFKDLKTRVRARVVASGNHVFRAGDGRAVSGHQVLQNYNPTASSRLGTSSVARSPTVMGLMGGRIR